MFGCGQILDLFFSVIVSLLVSLFFLHPILVQGGSGFIVIGLSLLLNTKIRSSHVCSRKKNRPHHPIHMKSHGPLSGIQIESV